MKSLRWSYLRTGFLIFLQGALVTILFSPWIQLAANYWRFDSQLGSFWVFLSASCSIVMVMISLDDDQKRLGILFFALAISLITGTFCHLPPLLSMPLALVFLFLGGRFVDYPSQRILTADWGWSSLILIFSSFLQPQLGYQLGIARVLLFFTLSMIALILWNTIRREEKGLRPDYYGLGRSISLFIVGVVILALFLGAVLSPSILQKTLKMFGIAYHGLTEVLVFLFVRPLAWLMTPLFRWAERVEIREFSLEIPVTNGYAGDLLPGETTLSPGAFSAITWTGWLLAAVILSFFVWIVFRWVLRKRNKDQEFWAGETRESVFSAAELLTDLKNAFRSVIRPFSREMRWYRGGEPLRKIRTIYARFVVKTKKKVAYPGGATPLEYSQNLIVSEEEVNNQALQSLTELYNQARYRERGNQKTAQEAEQAFRQLVR